MQAEDSQIILVEYDIYNIPELSTIKQHMQKFQNTMQKDDLSLRTIISKFRNPDRPPQKKRRIMQINKTC